MIKIKKIVVATNNINKLKEIKEIFKEYELLSLKDINCNIEVEEDGKTFEENAKKKAGEIAKITNLPVLADDSGLCIKALNDWPGVYTDRFLGENATSEQKNQAILDKMKNLKEKRTIRKQYYVKTF